LLAFLYRKQGEENATESRNQFHHHHHFLIPFGPKCGGKSKGEEGIVDMIYDYAVKEYLKGRQQGLTLKREEKKRTLGTTGGVLLLVIS